MCFVAGKLLLARKTKQLETMMSRIKIYLPLLLLGFIVSACGGGNGGSGGGNSSNTTPTLSSAQRSLITEVHGVLANEEEQASANAILPEIARNFPSTVDEVDEVTGNDDSLPGKYYVVLSDQAYVIDDTEEQRNKLRNPTLVRESDHSDLGRVAITLDITNDDGSNGELEIVMLFNDAGNSVIALSTMGDFVAGGKPFTSLPTGPLTYSGKNYYKVAGASANQIQNGDFDLSVDFTAETGTFDSGLTGNITLDVNTGNYTGIVSLDDNSHENLAIKGKFHGDSASSSVTGLYQGGDPGDTSTIFGAIIGTSN